VGRLFREGLGYRHLWRAVRWAIESRGMVVDPAIGLVLNARRELGNQCICSGHGGFGRPLSSKSLKSTFLGISESVGLALMEEAINGLRPLLMSKPINSAPELKPTL